MSSNDQISVREYVERILEERENALNKAASERQRADELARLSLDREVSHLNKLRDNVITKDEYTKGHEQVTYRLDKLEQAQARMLGAAAVIGALVGSLISHFWK